MTRGLATRDAPGADFLSLLMLEPGYLQRPIEIGEADAEDHLEGIAAFEARGPTRVDARQIEVVAHGV